MALRTSFMRQLENPDLNRNSRALLRCKLAREMEDKGNYEEAREVIGELWQRAGERPNVEKLEPATAAEVLMRVGVLTGHLADRYQIENAQEKAKNLISEASAIFESVDNKIKILEAQTEISKRIINAIARTSKTISAFSTSKPEDTKRHTDT